MHIYLLNNGQPIGPFTTEQIQQKVWAGDFLPNDLCWYEGISNWTSLSTISDLNVRRQPTIIRNGVPTFVLIGVVLLVINLLSIGKSCNHQTLGGSSSSSITRPTKGQWRAKLVQNYGQVAVMNIMPGWRPSDFMKIMGNPDRTQSIGDRAYWYYDFADGAVQLDMNALNLAAGVMQGNINDY